MKNVWKIKHVKIKKKLIGKRIEIKEEDRGKFKKIEMDLKEIKWDRERDRGRRDKDWERDRIDKDRERDKEREKDRKGEKNREGEGEDREICREKEWEKDRGRDRDRLNRAMMAVKEILLRIK